MNLGLKSFIHRFAKGLLVAALMAEIGAAPALAAYDQPVTWSDMISLDLARVFKSPYASSSNLFEPTFPSSALDVALRDADSRVSAEFRVPAPLRPRVSFWLKVYTEYTTRHVVFFDSHHPEIVYEVKDFRDIAKSARNQVVYEVITKKKLKASLAAYRAAFKHLSKTPHPKSPTPEEKAILRAVKKSSHKHGFAELARNLRTQTGQRDNIIKGLLAADAYFPKMETIFSRMNLPLELTRLPLVESSFDVNAISRKGASGIWQFMRGSGSSFLVIDPKVQVDERLSPLKSTVAAGKLLRSNQKIMNGSWALAVTAYNQGMRGLLRLRRHKQDMTKLDELFGSCSRQTSKLGWAGRNYYSEFLAVVHAEAYRHLFYGEPPRGAAMAKTFGFAQLQKRQTAAQFAASHGIPLAEFKVLNPDVRNVHLQLPKGFWVAMPDEGEDLMGLIDPPGTGRKISGKRSTRKRS